MKIKIVVLILLFFCVGVFACNNNGLEINLIPVRLWDKCGFIDKLGKWVINPQFDNVCEFADNGMAAVKIDNQWGFIDTTGSFVILPQFKMVGEFSSNGLAAVCVNDKWGYINTSV